MGQKIASSKLVHENFHMVNVCCQPLLGEIRSKVGALNGMLDLYGLHKGPLEAFNDDPLNKKKTYHVSTVPYGSSCVSGKNSTLVSFTASQRLYAQIASG